MRTTVTRTARGYHAALIIDGRTVALTLPCFTRNDAARAGMALANAARGMLLARQAG